MYNNTATPCGLKMVFISKIREMSLQRFSIREEHTHTLTVVAVSLYEQILDHVYHSSWQSRTDLKSQTRLP